MCIRSQFAAVLVINCQIKTVKYFKNVPAPVSFPYLKTAGEVASFCYKLTTQKSEVAAKKTKNKKKSRVGSKVEKWRTPPLWWVITGSLQNAPCKAKGLLPSKHLTILFAQSRPPEPWIVQRPCLRLPRQSERFTERI